MKELSTTGFMSNRGRQVFCRSTNVVLHNEYQSLANKLSTKLHLNGLSNKCTDDLFFLQIVCSFLVRDMGIDWRMGAEWFETCLLDYDPCSNYGNWTYGAGNSISFSNMETLSLNSHFCFPILYFI